MSVKSLDTDCKYLEHYKGILVHLKCDAILNDQLISNFLLNMSCWLKNFKDRPLSTSPSNEFIIIIIYLPTV